MPRNRLLKYINIFIGLVILAALAAGYWALYRPLPQTSGSVVAPISAPASVSRDEFGVPLIRAATEQDAYFLQGYVTAQDRLFQMDLTRRKAAGELAEILGAPALETDREARQLGLSSIAQRQLDSLDPADRLAFAAYARGINFFLETHRNRLPPDFLLLGYEPRPWRIADCILTGLEVFRTLSTTWRTDFLKTSLIADGDPAKVRALFPSRSGLEPHPGSNAWAITGDRSSSGLPLLANDPHLRFSVPSFWYQVHLQAPGLDVAGMSIPGLPAVVIGHNQSIAWGVTSLEFDVQDLYRERLDARTGRYLYRGQPRQAGREQDLIRVRGGDPVIQNTWVTLHGPVIVSRADLQLALRWSAADPGLFQYPCPQLNRARDWEEFRQSLTRFSGPPLNFLYADTAGNIGHQVAGKLPIRSFDGSVVADGASGKQEWRDYIPFSELPSTFNPPSGILVSANENPFPEDYAYAVSGGFAPGYRARRIRELLKAKSKWAATDMLAVETDIYDAFLHHLGAQVVAAYEKRGVQGSGLDEAVRLLREWNGRMDKDLPAPLIARLLFQHLRKAFAEKAAPGAGVAYQSAMAPAVIERLLRDRSPDWFTNYDQLLLRSLSDAVEEGGRSQGPDVRTWRWGRANTWQPSGGTLTRLPLIGSFFQLEPAPRSGSPNTVQQINGLLGPSMRMVLDTADWDHSLAVLTTGQSGQRVSSHFFDQWKIYYEGKSRPFYYQQVGEQTRLEFQPAQ